MRFTLADIEINLTAGVIIKDGEKINVRAKTLLVLKYLITHQQEVVTKQRLLDEIWHDVIVQEQVLVQSIKEIRDILGSQVIKTYPRQGYQWTADLTEVVCTPLTKNPFISSKITKLIIILITVVVTFFLYKSQQAANQLDPQLSSQKIMTVAFLPVKNDMPDDIHNWVPIKGTEYLSQRLQQQSNLSVIESDKVQRTLPQLKNLHSPKDAQQIASLQNTLAADLIVQSRLLGYPQDFQLHYTLYLPHSVERGIEFADTVEKAFEQLVEKIALRYSDFTPNTTASAQHDFSNEAFARGIELYLLREYSKAIGFFSSALQTNNELLPARRYLAACYMNNNNLERGLALMQENIQQAKEKKAYREEMRSYLLLGVSLMNWHQANNSLNNETLLQAQRYIISAQNLADTHQDSLFIAYSHEELGKIKRLQKNYPQAIKLQQTALAFYQKFRGNYGQTRPLIELAIIANEQGRIEQSEHYFSQAIAIANENGVVTNQVAVLLAQADIKQAQGQTTQANILAKQALAIAENAKSNLLMARINAWLNNNSYYEIH
ncbi:tetratricopeptide repeat protein [Colwellia sp. D2M02]|uniref:tetratricopeptide repeat protein n=1 Tax=Colwellia sp. D2M02 TaxID=2841562 RepID=UPI001C08C6E5|nr:tetratricopeptide repeat protein [Colwellia sp. D2M02]MBU2893748.1 tetratricopeptide repeat protein [Colwellia sp. D2M02]